MRYAHLQKLASLYVRRRTEELDILDFCHAIMVVLRRPSPEEMQRWGSQALLCQVITLLHNSLIADESETGVDQRKATHYVGCCSEDAASKLVQDMEKDNWLLRLGKPGPDQREESKQEQQTYLTYGLILVLSCQPNLNVLLVSSTTAIIGGRAPQAVFLTHRREEDRPEEPCFVTAGFADPLTVGWSVSLDLDFVQGMAGCSRWLLKTLTKPGRRYVRRSLRRGTESDTIVND